MSPPLPAARIKRSDQSKPEDRREFISAHRSRVAITVGKASWKEMEGAGSVVPADGKHRVVDAPVHQHRTQGQKVLLLTFRVRLPGSITQSR